MRILFLQKRLILPADTGGKIRTGNLLKHLAQWHEITYLCNMLEQERPFQQAMRDLGLRFESIPWQEPPRRSFSFALSALVNLASRYPFNVDKDYDPKLRNRATELLRSEPFDLLVCDFVQMARNAIGLPVPSLLFQHNVESEVLEREADRQRGPFALYLKNQAARMRRFEGSAGRQFDRVVAVSQRDRQQFESMYGWKHVTAIDTAVDIDYFTPSPPGDRAANQLVFVGSMDWAPNVHGVKRFVQNIWPIIRQQIPDAQFTVVGRNPSRSTLALAAEPGILVTGTVTDIRPFLQRATLGIVPLYSGGGTRLKIFEMMATGCPVISTRLGAEGLILQNDEHLTLADDDREFAEKTIALLRDPGQQEQMSCRALQLVRASYSSETVARQFEQACYLATEGNIRFASFISGLAELP